MRFYSILSSVFLFIGLYSSADGQVYYLQPGAFLGAEMGLFRISLNRFEYLYESRYGSVPGAHAGFHIFSAYYVTGKFRHFEKGGKAGTHPETGKDLRQAKWSEDWFTLGLRIHPYSERKWNSYYGFGYSFYYVQEEAGLSLYDTVSTKKTGGGFYLELGIERNFARRAALFVEFEIASGGIGGRSGLEGQSIGGYNFSAGFTVWLF